MRILRPRALLRVGWGMLALGATACVNAAFAIDSRASIIVSWNEARGGASSLADDTAYASARAMIAADYPGTNIVGVSTITTANLSGANVIWIGADFDNTSAISPLSASEQSALLGFVEAGGTALIFGENDTYTAKAQAVNDSLFSQFGVHSTGTLANAQSYALPSPAFPISGPFGSVSALASNYAGWFDTLPASASVVANLAGNSRPVIAELPAGALGAGSGAMWVFGDSGGQNDAGTSSGDWNTLYANILSGVVVPEPTMVPLIILAAGGMRRTRRTVRSSNFEI